MSPCLTRGRMELSLGKLSASRSPSQTFSSQAVSNNLAQEEIFKTPCYILKIVSCNPDWCQILSGVKNDNELLILLSLPLESWVYKCVLSCSGRVMDVGLRHPANQASTPLPKLYPHTSKHFETLMDACSTSKPIFHLQMMGAT